MTAETQTFTHLESLLLFQSVAAYGNTADSFARISNSLKNSQLLQRSSSVDNDHLNPQALTELYLRLLKSEAKRSLQNAAQSSGQDAKKSDAAARQPDIPSPKIATIEDAEPHRHLEPLMINRLYDLYKDQVIQEITEDEKKYKILVDEVETLESDLKNLDVQSGDLAVPSTANADAPSNISRTDDHSSDKDTQHDNLDVVDDEKASSTEKKSGQTEPAPTDRRTRSTRSEILDAPSTESTSDSRMSGLDVPATSNHVQDISSKSQSSPKRSRTPLQQPAADNSKPATLTQINATELPSQQNTSTSSNDPASTSRSPHKRATRHTLGASEGATPDSRNENETQDQSQEKDGPNQDQSVPQQEDIQAKHLQPSHGKQDPLPSRAQPQSSLAARSGGMQLPPFQVAPQAPHHLQEAQATKPGLEQPLPKQVKSVQELQIDSTPAGKASSNNLETPSSVKRPSSTRGSQIKGRQGTFSTPGSDTKWKVMPGMPDVPLPRPRSRSISPLSDSAPSPGQTARNTPSRHPKTPAAASARETRKSKAKSAGNKTSSILQSNQERTRSQSVTSNADEGYFHSAQSTIRDVKHDVSTPNTDSAPTARQTRATRNAAISVATTSIAGKRKRGSTIDHDSVATPASNSIPPSPTPGASSSHRRRVDKDIPETITASRNFHKTSAPMLNNIGSHKHASLFSGPVSTRTAGYYDIIKRPTDLSTIRKAIAAGVKAVNSAISGGGGVAASPSASTPAATTSGDAGGTVTLPISRELVPPEGIVNGAQLEQEVMRMFANAVMFNEGDDGVVADTREMFEDTEKTIAAWKAAETGTESGDDAAGGGGAGDDGPTGGSVKRRRA